MQEFRFKDVDLTFNFRKLSNHDQEYLRAMTYETVKQRSVNSTGLSFNRFYPNVDNFTLFKNKETMLNYMSEFVGDYSYTASHLLEGKKYWFAWTHNKRQ